MMNPAHLRITNWTSPKKDNNTDNDDEQFSNSEWNFNGLSPQPGIPNTAHVTPFPQLLKDTGYFTVHVGKAHWGSAGTPGLNPYNLGFMVNVSGHSAGHPQSYFGEDFYGNKPGESCHRALVSDYLKHDGWKVFHIMPESTHYYHNFNILYLTKPNSVV